MKVTIRSRMHRTCSYYQDNMRTTSKTVGRCLNAIVHYKALGGLFINVISWAFIDFQPKTLQILMITEKSK